MTAIALRAADTDEIAVDACETAVPMRMYTDAQMDAYVVSGGAGDKAGAYGIQDNGFRPVAMSSFHGWATPTTSWGCRSATWCGQMRWLGRRAFGRTYPSRHVNRQQRLAPATFSSSGALARRVKRKVIVLVGFLLAGCSLIGRGQGTPSATATLPTPVMTNVAVPNPETAARKFLDAWRQGNYDAMYAMLSPLSQDSLAKADFVAAYKKVAQEAALTGVDYQIVASLVNPREAQVSYRITLHSGVVGDVTRDTMLLLKRSGQDWQIAWSAASILPELTGGNKLFLQVVAPTRANIYDRNGQALATEADVTGIYIIPNQIGDKDAEATLLTVLSRLLGERPESIQALYDNIRGIRTGRRRSAK